MNEGLSQFTIQTDDNPGSIEDSPKELAEMVNRGDRIFWRKRGVRSSDTMTLRERIHAEVSEQRAKNKEKGRR